MEFLQDINIKIIINTNKQTISHTDITPDEAVMILSDYVTDPYDNPSQFDLPVKVKDIIKGKHLWTCLYCPYYAPLDSEAAAFIWFRNHAMTNHWWGPSEKFLNDVDMAHVREQRQKYKDVMGDSDEETRAMNRMGL